MGVYIKGMEMPRNSRYCPFAFLDDWDKTCAIGGRYEWHNDGRCSGCPLVEVPPHGRLIDAEDARRSMFHPLPYTHITPSDIKDAKEYERAWNDALEALYECSATVIESEE